MAAIATAATCASHGSRSVLAITSARAMPCLAPASGAISTDSSNAMPYRASATSEDLESSDAPTRASAGMTIG
ncbi:hypothetical protein ACWEN6_40590 [Sphaerisporangium sp. NPDC004334]